MSEYKWVAQDKDGRVDEYGKRPVAGSDGWYIRPHRNIDICDIRSIKSWKKRCFDLSKFDYEIVEGKLIGIPKAAPDWLLKIKEIDIKAFDWITRRKNIDEICKAEYFEDSFEWDKTKKGTDYWLEINDQLIDMLTPRINRHPDADVLIAHLNDANIKVQTKPNAVFETWYEVDFNKMSFRFKPEESK